MKEILYYPDSERSKNIQLLYKESSYWYLFKIRFTLKNIYIGYLHTGISARLLAELAYDELVPIASQNNDTLFILYDLHRISKEIKAYYLDHRNEIINSKTNQILLF